MGGGGGKRFHTYAKKGPGFTQPLPVIAQGLCCLLASVRFLVQFFS